MKKYIYDLKQKFQPKVMIMESWSENIYVNSDTVIVL